MKKYSNIAVCPEILSTLDEICSEVRGQYSVTYNLCYDWMKKMKTCYVLEYSSPLSKMESFAPVNYRDAYRNYESMLQMSGFDYSDYMEKIVPKRIFDNITFLRLFISIYFYDSEEYGSLLPKMTVQPRTVKVFRVEEDKLIKIDV